MKALSIRAPWWWYILHGGKDFENRDWPTKYRGPILIHASKSWRPVDVEDDNYSARNMAFEARGGHVGMVPNWHEVVGWMKPSCGRIVGVAEIVDCVTDSPSPWFVGRYGFKLANPSAFKHPIPCKGMLGLFSVPDDFIGNPERKS